MPNRRPSIKRASTRYRTPREPKLNPTDAMDSIIDFFEPIDDRKVVMESLNGSECETLLISRKLLLEEDKNDLVKVWEEYKTAFNRSDVDNSDSYNPHDKQQVLTYSCAIRKLARDSGKEFAKLAKDRNKVSSIAASLEALIRSTYEEAKKEWELLISYLKARIEEALEQSKQPEQSKQSKRKWKKKLWKM
ncbi:hypothetical protein NHQ30_011585 [Ciborinia camelliae]|nr:hypothetical protein NHQ30_011585 [Ciborinia camelliae]